MNIFISGGCGQVGSHVAELLLARGDSVVVVDNFATGRPEHLAPHPRLAVVEGDIADKRLVDDLVRKHAVDVIVHAAAAYKDPDDWHTDTLTNCVGGANLIMAAKANGVKRFIYYQTALCYGTKPMQNPIPVTHFRFPNNSSYSISKTTTEEYLELSGLSYVSFRLANVVGPRNLSGALLRHPLPPGLRFCQGPCGRQHQGHRRHGRWFLQFLFRNGYSHHRSVQCRCR